MSAEAEIDARLVFVVELASAAQCAGSTSDIVAAVDPRTNTAPVAPVAEADIVATAGPVDVESCTENLLAAFVT